MVERYLTYISAEKRYSKLTVNAYKNDIEQFIVFFKEQYDESNILSTDLNILRTYIVFLIEEGLEESTLHRKFSALKSFFKYCVKQGCIEVNPVNSLKLPKKNKRLPAFVEESKIDDILSADLNFLDFKEVRDYLILALFYATGLRLAELINLKDAWVDLELRQIKVLGKRNKERIIPLPKVLCENIITYRSLRENELRQVLAKVGEDNFFITNKGKPMSRTYIYRLVNSSLKANTNLAKCSPHVLRHTFATHMLNNGASLSAIKDLLGHSSLASTQVYTHNTIERLKSAYKQAHPKA